MHCQGSGNRDALLLIRELLGGNKPGPAWRRALAADPDWQTQVTRHNLTWSLDLFSTPAGGIIQHPSYIPRDPYSFFWL